MAEYDLSKTIIPYLDRHLSFPLLTHLTETNLFPADQIQLAQYELAKGTNMFDYSASLFEMIYEGKEVPSEFDEKRQNAVSTNERLQQEAQAVLDVIENPDVAQALRQDKIQNLVYLKDNYGLTLDQIRALYNFGQFQYSYGNYSGAADYLYHFRVLSTDNELNTSAHWGKLACDILTGRWDVALEELNTLRESIDSRSPSALLAAAAAAHGRDGGASGVQDPALAQLHSRTWLAHWSLFVYFNHPQGRTLLLETFLSPTYLNTIQTSCPWILRYIAAAAILSRKAAAGLVPTTIAATTTALTGAAGAAAAAPAPPQPISSKVRHAIKEVIRVIQTEEYQYVDPVTSFLKELYVEFDFEQAQKELVKAEEVVGNDFFLNEFKEEFLDNARYLISEAYCRIHQKIDIANLSERLNLSHSEGEKYLVNLVRSSSSLPSSSLSSSSSGYNPFSLFSSTSNSSGGGSAKIDLEKNVIEIYRPAQPVYQSVIERTRQLGVRTQAMGVLAARVGLGGQQGHGQHGGHGGQQGQGGKTEKEKVEGKEQKQETVPVPVAVA